MQLEVGPEAEAEINDAFQFYHEKTEGLGNDFLAEVSRVLGQIQDTAMAGTPMGGTIRRYLLRRFPFSILYWIRDDTVVVVVALMHHRRRPGYWKNRI